MKYTYNDERMPVTSLNGELRGINPICLDILYRRGYQTNEEIKKLLFPSFENAIAPLNCKDIDIALSILEQAVKDKDHIVVYRDYDVDGITAGAVAVESLRGLGAYVDHYANHRDIDGFGICKNGIDNILIRWPDARLILTVDNGITGVEAINYAKEKGLKIIVTDHHETGPVMPDNADAVIDLKRPDETYYYHDLCGCGLIFRVMLDLYRKMRKNLMPVLSTLDMVALASVADVVPLIDQNRALVKEGIKMIEASKRPFFRAIIELNNISTVNAHYTLGFQIAPVLNSLARTGKGTDIAVEALISKDLSWVEEQVKKFMEFNEERRNKTREQTEIAMKMVADRGDEPIFILYNEEFEEGIVGIIAGHLKDKFWRPVIVLARDKNGNLKGSGRSIDEFDLKTALDECADLIGNYGGHKIAVGVSLPKENLDAFAQKLSEIAKRVLGNSHLHQTVAIDAVLDEQDMTEFLVNDLRILEPYGAGFSEPVFGLKASPNRMIFIGKKQQHVKLTTPNSKLSIILWNKSDVYRGKNNNLPHKFVGKPSLNVWHERTSVQFIAF